MDLKIKIKDLSIRFKNQIVFDKASLSIDNAGFYCIMGRNGCGKSTLLKAILSYVEYDGTIDVLRDGKNEKGLISYCMADPVIYPEITVFDNLRIVCNDDERIKDLASKFEIEEILNLKGKYCSAGEKQRVCILRTILEDNPIMFFDEATSHLDDYISEKVLNILSELSQTKIIVYITHYEKEVATIANKIFRIEDKKIICNDIKECIGSVESKTSTHYYNEKILNKILKWRFRWPFVGLFIILAVITLLCLTLTTLNPNYVYKQYQSNAINSKYSQVYLNPSCNKMYMDVVDDKLISEIKSTNDNYKIAYHLNQTPGEYYYDSGKTSLNAAFFLDVLIDNDLDDYDIIMPTFIYEWFKEIDVIEDNYLLYNRIKFNIYDTIYYDIDLPNEYIVMNDNTYFNLLYEFYFYEQDFLFDFIEYNDVVLESGRLPEADGEVIVDSSVKQSRYIEGNTLIFPLNEGEEECRFEIVGYYTSTKQKKSTDRKKLSYTSMYYYLTTESTFKSRISYNKLKINARAYPSLYIDSTKIKEDDIKVLLDNGLMLSNDKWFDAYYAQDYVKNNRSNIGIITSVVLIIDVVSVAIYFLLNKEDNKDNYYLMKIMRLPDKKKNKTLKLQSVIFLLVYSFVSFGGYILFDYIIKKSLSSSIKDYIVDMCDYTYEILNVKYRLFFEYGIYSILIGIVIQICMYFFQKRMVRND